MFITFEIAKNCTAYTCSGQLVEIHNLCETCYKHRGFHSLINLLAVREKSNEIKRSKGACSKLLCRLLIKKCSSFTFRCSFVVIVIKSEICGNFRKLPMISQDIKSVRDLISLQTKLLIG